MTARLDESAPAVRSELCGKPVEILESQTYGGITYSYLILVERTRRPIKVAAKYVIFDEPPRPAPLRRVALRKGSLL